MGDSLLRIERNGIILEMRSPSDYRFIDKDDNEIVGSLQDMEMRTMKVLGELLIGTLGRLNTQLGRFFADAQIQTIHVVI